MKITDKKLDAFREWLVVRGRADGTAALYIANLRSCRDDPKGLTHRLTAGSLSPNSRRTNLAALRAWAAYSKQPDLTENLSDLKLPPARRVRAKQPLELEEWRTAVRHLQTCRMRNEALRQAILIIALRGLRVSDVLRIQRVDARRALDTGKLVYEGKGRKRIEIAAAPIRPQLEALHEIKGWERVRDLISSPTSKPDAARKLVWRAVRRTAKKMKILDMSPHRYRHTFATNFLKQLHGDPNALIKLQKFMGWESISTAARYVDAVSQDELDTIGAGLVSGLLG